MKALYIFTALIGLQFNGSFAAGYVSAELVAEDNFISGSMISRLAPVLPVVAEFEETPEFNIPLVNNLGLIPDIPGEADFNDNAPESTINTSDLAPQTPDEADFEDIPVIPVTLPRITLAPVLPAEADFEETF